MKRLAAKNVRIAFSRSPSRSCAIKLGRLIQEGLSDDDDAKKKKKTMKVKIRQ